jgi:NADP-dependent 3-hydroxy acid dehydrogenase YdfG
MFRTKNWRRYGTIFEEVFLKKLLFNPSTGIAKIFANENWHVIGLDRNTPSKEDPDSENIHEFYAVDLANAHAIDVVVSKVKSEFKKFN